jgi:Flp pilus assembly protein TadD
VYEEDEPVSSLDRNPIIAKELSHMAVPPSHLRGIRLFKENRIPEALLALDDALREGESAELWNDWATAHVAAGRFEEAEKGFGRALELDPKHCQAAVNLGVLLAGSGRLKDAIPLLKAGATGVDEEQRKIVKQLLKESRSMCRLQQKARTHKPRAPRETNHPM